MPAVCKSKHLLVAKLDVKSSAGSVPKPLLTRENSLDSQTTAQPPSPPFSSPIHLLSRRYASMIDMFPDFA